MALQPILGYPSSYKAPFSAVQILFGQGPSTAGGGERPALYVGPKSSAGVATVDTVYEVNNEATAITLFGPGSPAHRMPRKHIQTYPDGKVYVMCYAASSGGSPATATGTITITGPATATGKIEIWAQDEKFEVAFASGDSATAIGDNVEAAVNAKTWLPFTATNASGTVTLTAKIAGASAGDGTTGVHRFRTLAESGKGVGTTDSGAALGLGSGTAGADGTTTELANLTAALATINATRYYYMGFSVWSATAIAIIKTHISNKSEPKPGLRSRGFTGYTGTKASLATIAIGVNYERRHIVWQENSEHDVADLVGWCLAIHQKFESIRGGFVPDEVSTEGLIKPAYANADWPDGDDIDDAVTDGFMAIASTQTGAYMPMSVNTRSKDSTGALDDFRATETHRISFLDDFADTWLVRDKLQWKGKMLQDDPRLPNGDIDYNAIAALPPNIITPSIYAGWFKGLITEFSPPTGVVLQNPDAWKASLKVNIDNLNVSRIECGASGRTMDLKHQTTLLLSETTPG